MIGSHLSPWEWRVFRVKICTLATSEMLEDEPSSVSKERTQWLNTINGEINSFHLNNAWTLVHILKGSRLVICKWIFKLKYGTPGCN